MRGREFQIAGAAKEKDRQPIFLIGYHNEEILVGGFKRSWRNVRYNQIKTVAYMAGCWKIKTLKVSVAIIIQYGKKPAANRAWGGGGKKHVCYDYNHSFDFPIFFMSYIFYDFFSHTIKYR